MDAPVSSRSRPAPALLALAPLTSVRLLDQARERVRSLHHSRCTEDAYVHWIRAFVRHSGMRHPRELDGAAVGAFLSWLATERGVSVATHRQALSALLFLYAKVLNVCLPWVIDVGRPREQRRLPVVLTHAEVAAILGAMQGEHRLLAALLYGTGLRLLEGLQRRVEDLDFGHHTRPWWRGRARARRIGW